MRSAGGGGTSVSLFGSARPAPVASCIGHHGSIPGAEAIEMPSTMRVLTIWCAILESEVRTWLGVGLRFGSEGWGR